MEGQIVLPGINRLTRHQLRGALHGARLPYDEIGRVLQTRAVTPGRPVHTRGELVKILALPMIVALIDILRVRAARMGLRETPLELEYPARLGLRIRDLRKLQHSGDMSSIL